MTNDFIAQLKADFTEHADTVKAIQMQQYMKNHFPFLGIQKPERNVLLKPYISHWKGLSALKKIDVSKQLWDLNEREYQYACISLHLSTVSKIDSTILSYLLKVIGQKSWWDTVDILSANLIGSYFKKNSNQSNETMIVYSLDTNIWYNRLSLLYQLKYKSQTDTAALSQIINNCKHKNDFFIQKAIGWILREYSKTNPDFVVFFLNKNALSKLAVREASKYLKV